MKIRTDFVTNSSSSSFILGFNSKDEIHDVITNSLPSYWSESAIQEVIDDVVNGITSNDAALDVYSHSIWPFDFVFNGKSYWDMTRSERNSVEYQNFVQNEKDEMRNELAKELNEYDVISVVEYEDHTDFGCEMEHHIMPGLSCMIRSISHH